MEHDHPDAALAQTARNCKALSPLLITMAGGPFIASPLGRSAAPLAEARPLAAPLEEEPLSVPAVRAARRGP